MRVLLVNPPHPWGEGAPVTVSLPYLAAVLEKEGIETRILDLLVSRYSLERLKEEVKDSSPDIVGATSVTMTYPSASNVLKNVKKIEPEITTVIGGPHVTFMAEETLKEAPWIDFVVIGEGEYTLLELAKAVDEGDGFGSVKGIGYRDDGEVNFTSPRPPIENLDELPIPARGLLPLSKYRALGVNCNVITSRGCPWRCIFCAGPRMFGRKMRYRDPELVVDELEKVRDLGFNINIADDTFTLNHDHVYAILDEISRRGLDIQWTAFSRVDTLSQDLLERMKEEGCTSLFFGVESGNQEILDTTRKGITLDEVKKAVEMTEEAGIHVISSYILGLPGETPETLKQTLDFASELDTEYTIHVLAPLPGTELYDESDEYGIRILTDDWEKFNANAPITETVSEQGKTGAEEIGWAIGEYIEICKTAEKEIMKRAEEGDESSIRALRLWETLDFVTKLIKGDMIRKKGKIELDGINNPSLETCIEGLESKISGAFDDSPYPVTRELRKLVNEGNLAYDVEGTEDKKIVTWRWT